MLYRNAQPALTAFEELIRGMLRQITVYPRAVLERALHHDAAAMILSDNHWCGSTAPSRADELLTQTFRSALSIVDIGVVDHLIVAGAFSLSFAECGRL